MEVTVFDVNFDEEFKIITHPSLSAEGERLRRELENIDFTSHFAIFSSGTSSRELKGYVLYDKAMEANARAVNEWFSLTSHDVWGLSLPVYHVGGLSVLVRARLLGNKIIDLRKWDPVRWHQTLTDEKVTITTIVPTQLYDLVRMNLAAPSNLNQLIVGGDFLPTALEMKARLLGWPVIRTYGMSEVCSQLASGKKPGDKLEILPIHRVKVTEEGLLAVKSPALFSARFILGEKFTLTFVENLSDPEGFYLTEDRVELNRRTIRPLGRQNQEIKVAGHLTNVLVLKDSLASVLLQEGYFGEAEIIIENDERKGHRLVLLHKNLPGEILGRIAEGIRPAVLDEARAVRDFSRTELGKMKTS